ncbi:hybrid sensor histidine kinase/response regulator [Variovorax fucosicus]|uniref:hybrid sensor histidine kinase/response regulator n=1 Tax=Variovorax fucosicus TaxID=3053517 RepID=UPI00257667A2|nr:PAS domain-containing sensor histidine kinase [Variovorax sp. J22G47]MDM0056744.1 PAS domain S-box protein [Variovorax sp. J22G47]
MSSLAMEQQPHTTSISTEERYRLLVDAVADSAIYMLDPDGFIVSWNVGAERLKGYTESEIVGRHFSVFYGPEDVQSGLPARALAAALKTGRFESEGWRHAKGGRRFWAHVVVHPIWSPAKELLGYAKVTRDLSERRAAEEALRRSEEQFRLLVQAVTDYAIYMLDPEGIITNWNSGGRRIKGYEPAEVIGTHFSRFYRAEDRNQGLPARALAIAAAEGRFEGEGWRVRKDGTEFWASVVIDPIYGGNGELRGFAKVTRDITEKRNAQLALEQTREALFQSQKLDAIGQLTGGVAHDFNNLLMVILTSLELLRRRMPADEKLRQLVDNATQGAKRGVSLTQRMLAFARRQELRPESVHLPFLIGGMTDMLERTLGPTILIERKFAESLSPVLVDPHQLELAILNLAVNARDAMPNGGTLRLEATQEVSTTSQGRQGGEFVRLSVSDSGSGMNPEVLARAMEPFFTTKGVGKGTGLGLAMVQGLAVQSGGKFVMTSTEGVGTTALLWLPLARVEVHEALPAGQHAAPPPAAAHCTAALKVVAVDDDPLVLAGTASMLEDLGHSVLSAAGAMEALGLIRNEPGIDLVISDQVMPRMTGLQLFEVLRKEHPELRLILASGFADWPASAYALAVKVAKPFDQQQLADAIGRAMGAGGPG